MRYKFWRVIILVLLCAVFIGPIESSFAEQPATSKLVVKLYPGCKPGSYSQPNGPFAVLVFCESALGDYIALYYEKPMGSPISFGYPKWPINDRVWQDSVWASDVSSFAWSPSGKFLYAATSNIYGEGGIFEIDLARRVSKRVFPAKWPEKEYGYFPEILEFDEKASLLKVRESITLEPGEEPEIAIHEIRIR